MCGGTAAAARTDVVSSRLITDVWWQRPFHTERAVGSGTGLGKRGEYLNLYGNFGRLRLGSFD